MPLWLWVLEGVALAQEGATGAETTIWQRVGSFMGLLGLILIGWLVSEHRWKVRWRPVLWGVALQLVFGFIVLSPAVSQFFYDVVGGSVRQLLEFAESGSNFVFQTVEPHGVYTGDPDDIVEGRGMLEVFAGRMSPPVKTFAFYVLPTIIFFSSLMSVLYHVGVMQLIVRAIAWLMMRTLGTSGAESLSAAGNIFVGQTEAPLLIRPFVDKMTRSELMAVMVGGFATVAGGVLGAYAGFLRDIPNIEGHLVIASIMSAPAALAVAKMMVPETEESLTAGEVKVEFPKTATNTVEAAAKGASDGMKLALNVAAMLIAIVALVALFDWLISWVPLTYCAANGAADGWQLGYACPPGLEGEPLSMSILLGWVFAPVAVLMGVPFAEASVVGRLLGEKIVLTEFVAFISLGELVAADAISERSAVIATYGLCGFANFASIGIQLGGIGGIAPGRMSDLASLGFRAMLGGVLAACMTGAVVGMLL